MCDHLTKKHPNKKDKDLKYFQTLSKQFANRSSIDGMINKITTKNDDGLVASYNISLLIAKCGKPHTIGKKLILPAIREFISTVMHQDASSVVRSIPLSNNSVARRIDELAIDVEQQLCKDLQTTEFALQLDESTLRDNEALLMAYVRYIHNGVSKEEMLFSKPLETDTRGETIFMVVKQFCEEKNIPIGNIIACATNGAPSMIGRHRGFIAHLKRAVPNVFSIHCVIHRQHLIAKHLSANLHQSLQIVITATNKIKKNSLNDRIFQQLCENNDEDYKRLLLHTEVRWLSKGNCLKRFHQMFDSIVEFLEEYDSTLAEKVKMIRSDVAYLADIFEKLNIVNKQLQGNNTTLIQAKGVVLSFLSKLTLFRQNIARREFGHLPCLRELDMANNNSITDDNIHIYCSHIDSLCEDLFIRFKDLTELVIPNFVINPFETNIETFDPQFQEEFIDLQNDIECNAIFTQCGYNAFWMKKEVSERYPHIYQTVKLMFVAFPSSYLVEKGFSTVVNLLTKQRNRLEISTRGDLRLFLTQLEPDVVKLAKSHQSQGSHVPTYTDT